MPADGSVDLTIDVNISNVTDIAKEIASQLNLDRDDTMPTGKSKEYKDVWLEASLMKSIVKTMGTNYDEMLNNFETLNKQLQVNVGKELKDIISKGKDFKVDIGNIEAITEEFIDAMAQFMSNFDFPQVGKEGIPSTAEPKVSRTQLAVDYIKESAIINTINANMIPHFLNVSHELNVMEARMSGVFADFYTDILTTRVTFDDVTKLVTEVMMRATQQTQSRQEAFIKQQPLLDVQLRAKEITGYDTEEKLAKWIESGIEGEIPQEKMDELVSSIQYAQKEFLQMEDSMTGIKEEFASAIGEDVDVMTVSDVTKRKNIKEAISSGMDKEDYQKLVKFSTLTEFLAHFNLRESGKKTQYNQLFTENKALQGMLNRILTLKTGFLQQVYPTGENVEALVRSILQTINPLLREKPLSAGGRRVIDISLDQADLIKKKAEGTRPDDDPATQMKMLIDVIKNIDMLNFEIRSGGAGLSPRYLKEEIDRMLTDYATQIAEGTGYEFESKEEKERYIIKLKALMKSGNPELAGLLSQKIKLWYPTDKVTGMKEILKNLATLLAETKIDLSVGTPSTMDVMNVVGGKYEGGINIGMFPFETIAKIQDVATENQLERIANKIEQLNTKIVATEIAKEKSANIVLDDETKSELTSLASTMDALMLSFKKINMRLNLGG